MSVLEGREDISEDATFGQRLRVKPVWCDPSLRKFGENTPGGRNSECRGPEGGIGFGGAVTRAKGRVVGVKGTEVSCDCSVSWLYLWWGGQTKERGTLAARFLQAAVLASGHWWKCCGWPLGWDHLYTLVGIRVRSDSVHASRLPPQPQPRVSLPHLLGLLIWKRASKVYEAGRGPSVCFEPAPGLIRSPANKGCRPGTIVYVDRHVFLFPKLLFLQI